MTCRKYRRTRALREFNEYLCLLNKEAAGAFRLEGFFLEHFVAVAELAYDPKEIAAVRCVLSFLDRVDGADSAHQTLCMACDNGFGPEASPHAVGALVPCMDDGTTGLAFGVCAACCATCGARAEVGALVAEKLRENLIPGARVVPFPMTVAGHA
jgi:hypothetical protein